MHTASVRNIIIRWTSHDDLTEKYEETFFHFIETTLTHKTHERTKIQNCTLQFDKKKWFRQISSWHKSYFVKIVSNQGYSRWKGLNLQQIE